MIAADTDRSRSSELYRFVSGSTAEVWQRVQDGAVVISEPFAYRHGLPLAESEILIQTDQGLLSFPVVGVYYDYASDRGTVLMANATYRRYWSDSNISSIAVYVRPGEDLAETQTAIQLALGGTGLIVQPNRALRAQALEIFDRTFAITSALRLLAVVVAFVGVLSALLALQLERRREMATLRALGLSSGGLQRLSALESGLMGLTAGLLSLPTGVALAYILIYVINLRSFGWSIQPVMPLSLFGQALLVGIGAAVLASVAPGRRLARMALGEALRAE